MLASNFKFSLTVRVTFSMGLRNVTAIKSLLDNSIQRASLSLDIIGLKSTGISHCSSARLCHVIFQLGNLLKNEICCA